MAQGDMAYKIADEWGLPVFPVIPQGKRPMDKGWADIATTDPLTISKAWAKTPNANIGIPTGSTSGVIVIDLDNNDAIAWFEGLEIPLGAEVHTPSGGKHYYYAIDPDVEIKTSVSEIHRGVDVRAEGGLVVGPGSVIAGKMYRGDLSHIPEAPQELLDLLPRRQHFSVDPIPEDVEPVEAASEQERRELEWITAELDGLERPWREGAGWRSTVFGLSCWLWRMVRSPYYATGEASATTLLLTHAPSDEKWSEGNVIAEWEDAKKRTAGQYAQPPLEVRPPLEPWHGFPTHIPFPSINGEAYFSLWSSRPRKEGAGHLWQRRHVLLVGALKAGMSEAGAATVAWHSAAARGDGIIFDGQVFGDDDSRCIDEKDLWREVDQAKEEIAKDNGEDIEEAPAAERPSLIPTERPKLLTDAERSLLASSEGEWWGTRYINWAESTFSMVNLPYWRLNRWTLLSIIFSPKAVLPRPGGADRPINLYLSLVGPTTSGKTEALIPVYKVIEIVYMMQDSTPEIGTDFTETALKKALIDRDGKSSWFHMDEAHTKIHEWKKVSGPFSSMPGVITELYDGRVGAMGRSGDKDYSGRTARSFLTVHFMGTVEGMAAEMGPTDWESGFLNRFVWAIGDPPSTDPGALAGDWISEDDLGNEDTVEGGGQIVYQQWANEFMAAMQKVGRADGRPERMRLPNAVIERHKKLASDLYEIAQRSRYEDRLRSTFKRLNETALRCAALVALSEGRIQITKMDLLIATEQVEEWAQNILTMVELTDESIRDREVNMIERYLIDSKGRVTIASIHRIPRLQNRSREVDSLIGELIAQGRAERYTDTEGTSKEMLRLKGALHEKRDDEEA